MPVRRAPVFVRFEPEAGPPQATVTIHGKHFDETTRVRFNGRWLPVVARSDETLAVRIPPNGVSDNFVLLKAGFPEIVHDKRFHVVRLPQIQRFAPRNGPPGTPLTVFGAHFLPSDELLIGGLPMPITSFSPERVAARIPEGAGTANIAVRRHGKVIAHSPAPFEVFGPPPLITGFAPERGGRGTVVRIEGRHFEPADVVQLSGAHLPIRGRDPSFIEVVIGKNTSGRFAIVGPRGRRAESPGVFHVARPPSITGFTPAFGPPRTRITIEGAGFIPGDTPFIGDAMLTVRTVADGSIVAEVPAGVAGGPICVQRDQRRFCAKGHFDVVHAPAITNVHPRAAPPHAVVKIEGRHFQPDTSVVLAGMQLPIVARNLPSSLSVRIPPGARSGRLVLVTRAGSAQSPINFEVIALAEVSSFFPLHGPPGTRVTLRGRAFHPEATVSLAGLALPVVTRQPEALTVEIPAGARSGRFIIDSFGHRVESRAPFRVEEPRAEVEFSFEPVTGPRGSEVTLILSPPRQDVQVFYNGRPLPRKVLHGGQRLVVTVPGDANTGFFELDVNGRRYRAKQPFRVR